MQADRAYDVWLEELLGRAGEAPDEGLARVFGISREKAQEFVARIPRIVKHDASPQQARELGDALRAIGGRVRFEPAGTTPRRSRRPAAAAPQPGAPMQGAAAPAAPSIAAPAVAAATPQPNMAHAQMAPPPQAQMAAAAPLPAPRPLPASAETLKQGTSDVLATASVPPLHMPSSVPAPAPLHSVPAAPLPAAPAAPSPAVQAPPEPVPIPAPVAPEPVPMPAPAALAPPEPVPIPAPVAPAPVLPAIAAGVALDMALPSAGAPVEPHHPLEQHGPAEIGHEQAQQWSRVGAGGEQAFALDQHVLSHAGALNLPGSDRPPAPTGMRAASQRRPDPPRRVPTVAEQQARAGADLPRVVGAREVVVDIFKQAERSSWKVALHGHPVAGFILVMGTATTVALILYALVRI